VSIFAAILASMQNATPGNMFADGGLQRTKGLKTVSEQAQL
jgi:hypothetical protein